jgi:hypothetical protein
VRVGDVQAAAGQRRAISCQLLLFWIFGNWLMGFVVGIFQVTDKLVYHAESGLGDARVRR